jgi:predicted dehydrogenase
MRFALLGNHPDGVDFARALVESGRHELVAYSGPAAALETLRTQGVTVRPIGDIEEILADPAVEAVIVAGRVGIRAEQLRRALQSERHVLCAHPADQTPDIAYEAAMIQADIRQVLLPLLPQTLHPGVVRLRELAREQSLGRLSLIEMELASPRAALIETDPARHRPALPGWDVLRALGGEIAEVSAFAASEELTAEEPLLLTGKFVDGLLFRASYLPDSATPAWRIRVAGEDGKAELVFARGWPGPALLCGHDAADRPFEESWDAWDPWPALVVVFELAAGIRTPSVLAPYTPATESQSEAITRHRPETYQPSATLPPLTWQDEVRCLELDAAARRSVHYRRVSVMEYQEATEEAGFKGTMTLIGCGLLWLSLVLLIVSIWAPRVGWVIGPVLVLFLLLQLFRWIIPAKK